MKKTGITLLIGLGFLAACGSTNSIEPQIFNTSLSAAAIDSTNPALQGQAGDIEFTLDEEVFTVERSPMIFLIALALYLPFLVI